MPRGFANIACGSPKTIGRNPHTVALWTRLAKAPTSIIRPIVLQILGVMVKLCFLRLFGFIFVGGVVHTFSSLNTVLRTLNFAQPGRLWGFGRVAVVAVVFLLTKSHPWLSRCVGLGGGGLAGGKRIGKKWWLM